MSNSTTHINVLSVNQAQKDVTANGLFDAASPAMTYGRNEAQCSGLLWAYYGGWVSLADGSAVFVANGSLTLTASTTSYVVAAKDTGVVSASTATTNWDSGNYWRLYSCVTDANTVTSYSDFRELSRYTGYDPYLKPVIKTASFTVGVLEREIICQGTASITVTLPAAASFPGREINLKTIAAFTVVSASANVKPLATNTAGTAILAATAGKWARLKSDGANWVIMAGN